MEDRALLESSAHLVHTHHADVGARAHRPGRQAVVERQISTPCLVDDRRLAAVMTHSGDLFEIGARAIRTRADYQPARRIRVATPCSANAVGGWWVRDVPLGVPPRRHPSGLHAG